MPDTSSELHLHHGRLQQLDGLRAIAILMVIAQHDSLLPLGWAGVTLFFVLSGYLITGILRRGRHDHHFWGPFYIKRATRILPPLLPFFLLCALTTPVARGLSVLPYIFFGANIASSLPHAPSSDLIVLWSLAVEEHFYLLWPFAIRFLQRRSLVRVLAATLLVEPVVRLIATPLIQRWQPIYFLTPFQVDGLAAGALLAVLLEERVWRDRLRRWAGWGILASILTFSLCSALPGFEREQNTMLFNSLGYSLLVAASACTLALLLVHGEGWLSRLLSLPPLVWIGTISYGLYLLNGPVSHLIWFTAQSHGFHRGRILLGIAFVSSLIVSWVSFRFYESPLVAFGRRRAGRLTGGNRLPAPLHS